MKCEECRELLDAYHDGELQPATREAVAEHLHACPSCSAALAAYQGLRKQVRALGRAPAPPGLAAKIGKALEEADGKAHERARPVRFWGAMAASHLLVLALGGGLAFGLLQGREARNFSLQQTVDAHVRSLIDEKSLMQVASNDSHNVKPWFMGKLDFSPAVAELNKEDYPLLGGRVDYVANRYVAALVYGRRKHRINLFVSPGEAAGPSAVSAVARNGYNILEWQGGGLRYRAVSDLNAAELAEFAELIRASNGRS